MAIIKFINNKVGLKKTLNYICKEEKTENKLISGKDCRSENAYEEMMAIKNMYNKTGGREKLHFVQAFSPDDPVNYEMAHEITMKIADKFKGFQVVVATHQDTEHIHSHFVVNTVDFNTGRKIQFSNKDLERLKQYSNKLCQEYGLSITRDRSEVDDIKINEYKAKLKGTSWKEKLIENIESTMENSNSKTEFFKEMNKRGYKVTWTKERKNITFTTPEGYKCRDRKLHNEKFLKENMETYFKEKYKKHRISGVKKQGHIRYKSMSFTLAEIIQQFKNRENENIKQARISDFNGSAKKQYAMEMHYSLEELEDMEI